MSYRSIKRVLGESSLERKIRILFGVCLLALIAGSFLWVSKITEELIRENTRDRASDILKIHLLKVHFKSTKFSDDNPARDQFIKSIPEQFETGNYGAKVLVLDDSVERFSMGKNTALDDAKDSGAAVAQGEERELLSRMDLQWRDYKFKQASIGESNTTDIDESGVPVFRDLFLVNNKYVYYEPIEFSTDCLQCHYCLLYTSPSPRDS